MKYFVLVMLLLTSPVLADPGEDEKPDDVECRADAGGFMLVYTYRSDHRPKHIPEGLMCYVRDYKAQADFFAESSKHYDKYWSTLQ